MNGKVRSKIRIEANTSDDDLQAAALTDEKIKNFLQDKHPKKVIIISGKLVNVVIWPHSNLLGELRYQYG